ncbi:MAG: CHAT domain-containing protein [Cyanobacteriota bacterium]
MKVNRLIIALFLSILMMVIFLNSIQAQTGNQSDTTGPDPQEIFNNQSDTTGNDPQEIMNQGTNFSGNTGEARVDRAAFDSTFETAGITEAINLFEESQTVEFGQHLGVNFFGEVASAQEIAQTLDDLYRQIGRKAAVIYVVSIKSQLQLLLILANNQPIRKVIPEANRELVQKTVREFREKVRNPSQTSTYKVPAQQLYQWIVAPLESVLEANQIDTLVFSMDSGLRSIPLAALYDGKQFLIENYSVSLIPSFSLTDTRYFPISNKKVLAIGISKSTQGKAPLPGVAAEVRFLTNKIWSGQKLLNEQATIENFQELSRQDQFGIFHIATHAEFKPGTLNNSYIQFWDAKLKFDQVWQLSQKLEWYQDPKVELIVLSACKTALGDKQAELGFAGLTIQTGVKTAVGSLWYVSDEGSLALMMKFYEQLKSAPIKSEALQQAQLAMLKGQVRLEEGQLRLDEETLLPLSPELEVPGNLNLSHPYYWSGFTMIGNWN